MDPSEKKLYWKKLVRTPLFWIGLALTASYFFVDSVLIATLGMLVPMGTKYRLLNSLKDDDRSPFEITGLIPQIH